MAVCVGPQCRLTGKWCKKFVQITYMMQVLSTTNWMGAILLVA